ncbi:MAG: helicase-exonuclease AddAB subunit AddA [Firmicutes bacterium HGW-Firmicutes-3]|jgi:ATP-dependent helicase/nuclease subunit A|nr:MAG: helicase-exonuclease AddAB subunit AddA [Firmicutes bacterium HGW-Firmicutes-3]
MSEVRFTEQQSKVITTHGRNLLVSAAAGSGKTAVLVERIIRMITNKREPVSIDSLLVVTFTNAAASEMRERVGTALYSAIENDPTNLYLQQQLTLLPSANIMTLHAFCLQVIKNYFYKINLDPSFKIGDEIELTLIQNEVLDEVIEKFYTEGDSDYLDFIESYAPGKSDKAVEALVLSVYKLSRSHPIPEKWLDSSIDLLDIKNLDQWYDSPYVAYMMEEIFEQIKDLKLLSYEASEIIETDIRLKPMMETLIIYDTYLRDLESVNDNSMHVFEILNNLDYPRAKSAKRGTEPEVSEPVKALIGRIKDQLKSMQNQYGFDYDDIFLKRTTISHGHMKTLGSIIREFSEAYQAKKADKNMIDFNDIEHFALDILLDELEKPSEVAKIYADRFVEIMVDEYQDSNLVQERLIQSVSRIASGKPNIFMVGDMKQSIYKFRLAKPELFSEKYDAYTTEDSHYQKIELHQNFRSRKQILDMTNYLFTQLMSKKIGDVLYDDSAALNLGADYRIESDAYNTEVLLIEREGFRGLTTRQIEAQAVAVEIQRLMAMDPPMMIYDGQEKIERRLAYKDIVILMRTMTGWSEAFVETLANYGIPVTSRLATGYFDTIEIKTLLNLLRIIDNPKQDIPLLAVLRSPMFGFKGDELVTLRLTDPDVDFHSAMTLYYNSIIGNTSLDQKVVHFHEALHRWRQVKNSLSLYGLVQQIFEDTGYYDYVSMMLSGPKRQANLDMFLDQVHRYEQTSFKGLFNFLRYMEHMKKHSIDQGEALLHDEQGNQVTIMSIHGSKGLEYPVVILPALSKLFNKSDIKQSVLIHQEFGFGTDTILSKERIKIQSPIKEVLKSKMDQEMKSEELRILYVALTRAREKLIIIGSAKNMEKQIEKWSRALRIENAHLGYLTIKSCQNYLDWIMLALMRHSQAKVLYTNTGIEYSGNITLQPIEPDVSIHQKTYLDYQSDPFIFKDFASESQEKKSELNLDFDSRMAWTYTYDTLTKMDVSQSVSEIKRLEEGTYSTLPTREKASIKPVFIAGEQPMTGAQRGQAYHKVMYHLDFLSQIEENTIADRIQELCQHQIITEREAGSISPKLVQAFLDSDIGKRAKNAASRGQLIKEKPFVIGLEPELEAGVYTQDYRMVQGVVDIFFEEEEGLVIVDYKTDHIAEGAIDELKKRYSTQMRYYKKALEQGTGKPVKAIYLYALGISETVEIKIES